MRRNDRKCLGWVLLLTVGLHHDMLAQTVKDSIKVATKIWSRDDNHEIVYSDWKTFGCETVDLLKDFKVLGADKLDKYGGDPSITLTKTGFFHTQKIGERWWVVDPMGAAFINVAVNGVRQGKAPSNQSAFDQQFGSTNKWIAATKLLLDNTGFNMAGSWSDVESIRSYNQLNPKPLPYTTQLSLLGSFFQKVKKKTGNKTYPELACVFNPDFSAHCEEKMNEWKDAKDDPNLLGHFSDNELPFQENLLKAFMEISNAADPAYVAAQQWVTEKKIADVANLSKEEKQAFAGYVAERYYKTVSTAIKAADPNHMYIGSRLHASAKTNEYILNVVQEYADIVSINYYGEWAITRKHSEQWAKLTKPYIITEFYTKGEDSHLGNITGAGWLVKTQKDRGLHYQNFCLKLLRNTNCVGWHWFRYQDNAADDATADFSNKDSNKGMVNGQYQPYTELTDQMMQINKNVYSLIKYFDKK